MNISRSFILSRRVFSTDSPAGRHLETVFSSLTSDAKGKRLLDAYGECVDARLEDIKRNCCKIEYDALFEYFDKGSVKKENPNLTK